MDRTGKKQARFNYIKFKKEKKGAVTCLPISQNNLLKTNIMTVFDIRKVKYGEKMDDK